MATQGLNFQTHQFNDPTEGLQKALGAGSMFAQSLKSMQDFESEQSKLRMMQQEKDRQARLDAEHAEDRAAAKAEEAQQTTFMRNQITPIARAEAGNEIYKGVQQTKQEDYLRNVDDTKAGNWKQLASMQDALAGIDRTKLDKAGQDQYDLMAGQKLDMSQNTMGDGQPSYNASTQYGVLTEANVLKGMGRNEAKEAAALQLGLSKEFVGGVDKSNDELAAFQKKLDYTAMTDPLMGKTGLEKAMDSVADIERAGGTAGKAVLGFVQQAQIANATAAELKKKEIQDLEFKREQAAGTEQEKQYNAMIDMMKMQLQAIGGEATGEDRIARGFEKLAGSVQRGETKIPREDQFAELARDTIEKYGINNDDKGVTSRNIANAFKQGDAAGYSAKETAQMITANILANGTPEEREKQKYTFSSVNFPKRATSTASSGSNDDAREILEMRAQRLADTNVEKQKQLDDILKLTKARFAGESPAMAAIDKQLFEINRTPDQAFRATAQNYGREFAIDRNLGGYGTAETTRQLKEATAKAEERRKEVEAIGGTPEKTAPTKVAEIKTGNRMFDLDPKVAQLQKSGDNHSVHEIVKAKAAEIIRDREGTREGIYNVNTLNKDGSITAIPHIGYGVKIDTLAKANNMTAQQFIDGYNNPSTKSKFAEMAKAGEDKIIGEAYSQANRMAKEANLTLEAVPVLASTIYNLGPAWADKSNKRGFYNRWEKIKKGEFTEAAKGLDKSLWSKQAPGRPQDFVAMLNDQAMRKGTKFYNPEFKEIAKPNMMSDQEYDAFKDRLSKAKQSTVNVMQPVKAGVVPQAVVQPKSTAELQSLLATTKSQEQKYDSSGSKLSYFENPIHKFQLQLAENASNRDVKQYQIGIAGRQAQDNIAKLQQQINIIAIDSNIDPLIKQQQIDTLQNQILQQRKSVPRFDFTTH